MKKEPLDSQHCTSLPPDSVTYLSSKYTNLDVYADKGAYFSPANSLFGHKGVWGSIHSKLKKLKREHIIISHHINCHTVMATAIWFEQCNSSEWIVLPIECVNVSTCPSAIFHLLFFCCLHFLLILKVKSFLPLNTYDYFAKNVLMWAECYSEHLWVVFLSTYICHLDRVFWYSLNIWLLSTNKI